MAGIRRRLGSQRFPDLQHESLRRIQKASGDGDVFFKKMFLAAGLLTVKFRVRRGLLHPGFVEVLCSHHAE